MIKVTNCIPIDCMPPGDETLITAVYKRTALYDQSNKLYSNRLYATKRRKLKGNQYVITEFFFQY